MTDEELLIEWRACKRSAAYFIHHYCWIYDAEAREWIPFHLWPEQFEVIQQFQLHKLLVVLKARQLGMTWLFLALALWLMIFWPIATILIFSKRDDEAVYLLGPERLKGMYMRLPSWMQAESVVTNNDHEFMLSTGSVARAFPTTAGDGYTATMVLADEADLVDNLDRMIRSVKPTIDAGGWLVLLSRVDKSKPNSSFKKIYRAAKAKLNEWVAIFLPWWVHPDRDEAWYEREKRNVESTTGALDNLYEQYPKTDEEALAPAQLDKRIPAVHLQKCYQEQASLDPLPSAAPSIPGLKIFKSPVAGRRYVWGADPAEGLPTSDDSSTDMVDVLTGEQMAKFAGKFSPSVHAAHTAKLALYYNSAAGLPENNNHGHAFILWIEQNSRLKVLKGHIERPGWSNTTVGKVLLYDFMAEAAEHGECIIHDFDTLLQLQAIEKSTLLAPAGDMDDQADSFALAQIARSIPVTETIDDESRRVRIGW
jgi:hypothetical protein